MGDPSLPAPAVSTVLVVDDDKAVRSLLTRILEAHGCRVMTADDGEEALEKTKGKDIDLVLLDLTMPKCGGLETLTALKAVDPDIEVIMVTGHATLEHAVDSMKLGAYDFVTKPFQNDNLLRIVDRALDKRRLSMKVDELHVINRFRSTFFANMSHELRTPMNAILGYTSLLLDHVYGGLTPKQEESLKRVETAGGDLLQVINSILDISKLAAGRMPVYLEDFSLKKLSQEVLEMMECLAAEKKLTLKLDWKSAEDVPLHSDRTKVKQILVNLVTNAIKFTSTGGVFIEIENVAAAAQVSIRVRDTGIGIKAEDLRLLFHEFKQIDPSSTRSYGGTGLGLVISKKFAELMGGTITVESAIGEGTAFTVVLPFESRAPKEATTTVLALPAAGKHNKVLLAIDDDPEMLDLIRDSLSDTGIGFAGVLSGEEGIALARRIKPMAITLDVLMPHRDGWSVLQILKNDPELRSIPIIMLSHLDNRSLGFAMGVTAYIVKPFRRSELLEKLKAIEGGPSSQKPAILKALHADPRPVQG